MIGVILAAGKGTRIYPFSEKLPKPILPVGNKPLLEHQVEIMKKYGISEIIIVIGHLGYTIVDALGDGTAQGISIRYVEQTETLGMAHALGKLEPHIDSPFLLMLGDIYFITDDLSPMIEQVLSGEINASLASKIEPDPGMIKRNFAIVEQEKGSPRVRQVIEKPRFVRSEIKGCGIYLFDLHVFDAIRRTPRTAMRDEYEITDSIQIMINDGYTVCHSPVVKADMNLTVPEDLLKVNLMDLKRRNLDSLVGKNTDLQEGVLIENSVIGNDVLFDCPINLKDSLIFSGTQVTCDNAIESVIIHDGSTIQCNRNNSH